ncbi:hypothetical protein ACFQZJ_11710 [Maribacter chungangensis]|uniref:DUF4625 domain-containing protein n=1 Tax=Maribacter chungangensis TaxID=1069117 RepID=A0ABW3B4I0_9FLAO
MKKYFILAFFAVGVLAACTDRDDDVTTVNIRIQNSTDSFFQEVRIAGKDTVYENIAAGEFSEYLEYNQAFPDMSLTVVADSTTFEYGSMTQLEDALPIGFYTYELTLQNNDQLDLNFKID